MEEARTESLGLRVSKRDLELIRLMARLRHAQGVDGCNGDMSSYLRWLINQDIARVLQEIQERRRVR